MKDIGIMLYILPIVLAFVDFITHRE